MELINKVYSQSLIAHSNKDSSNKFLTEFSQKIRSPVLYEQTTANPFPSLIISTKFSFGLNNQAADDFIVPNGEIWNIDQVLVRGSFFDNTMPATLLNINFYNDDSGIPGTVIQNFLNYNSFTNDNGSLLISLPNVSLPEGHYWLSVQTVEPNLNNWFWYRTSTLMNDPGQFQSNNNTFNTCGTDIWTPITTCYFIQGPDPDLVFTLYGTKMVPPVCVNPEAKVHMVDGRQVPIKNVKAGDLVLDKDSKAVKVVYNMKFDAKVRKFIKIPNQSLGSTADLLIRKDHPIWYNGREICSQNLHNYDTNIREISLDTPINVYSLCTETRSFVLMNNLPVCTWEQKDWENKNKRRKIRYMPQ